MIEVRIPTVLTKHTGGARSVEASGSTVSEVIDDVERQHPGFRAQVIGEAGGLHRFINCYLNDEDIRFLQALDTKTGDGDVVAILPAVAGGGLGLEVQPKQAYLLSRSLTLAAP